MAAEYSREDAEAVRRRHFSGFCQAERQAARNGRALMCFIRRCIAVVIVLLGAVSVAYILEDYSRSAALPEQGKGVLYAFSRFSKAAEPRLWPGFRVEEKEPARKESLMPAFPSGAREDSETLDEPVSDSEAGEGVNPPAPIGELAAQTTVMPVCAGEEACLLRKITADSNIERELAVLVLSEARNYSLDPLLLASIAAAGGGNPEKGGIGVLRIDLRKGEYMAKVSRIDWKGEAGLRDQSYSLHLAAGYLRFLDTIFKGKESSTVLAYLWSPKEYINAVKNKSPVPAPVLDDARKVLRYYRQWKEA